MTIIALLPLLLLYLVAIAGIILVTLDRCYVVERYNGKHMVPITVVQDAKAAKQFLKDVGAKYQTAFYYAATPTYGWLDYKKTRQFPSLEHRSRFWLPVITE